MATPKVLILRAPGTNCDLETAFAFERAGAATERVHVHRLLEEPRRIAECEILCLPGGFSYGDDLGAGRILAARFRHHLADAVRALRDANRLVLGICNGFQVLIQSGLLLASDKYGPPATLTANDSGKFEDRWCHLGVAGGQCAFLAGQRRLFLPVAHAEGKFVARDEPTLDRLDAAGQLVLRYRRSGGEDGNAGSGARPDYPENPNGSQGDVAGVCDPTGRVFGLMPHPERHVDATQHPGWMRHSRPREGDGLALFKSAVAYFR